MCRRRCGININKTTIHKNINIRTKSIILINGNNFPCRIRGFFNIFFWVESFKLRKSQNTFRNFIAISFIPYMFYFRGRQLWEQFQKKAELYRTDVILVPHGDDVRYATSLEWHNQLNNLEKLMTYINSRPDFQTEVRHSKSLIHQEKWNNFINWRLSMKRLDTILKLQVLSSIKAEAYEVQWCQQTDIR